MNDARKFLIMFGLGAIAILAYFVATGLLTFLITGIDDESNFVLSWIIGGVICMFLALFCAHLAGLVTF